MYIDDNLQYKVIERTTNEAFQALWLEIEFKTKSNIICGVVYRQHNSADRFLDHFEESMDHHSASSKPVYLLGGVNINILRSPTCSYAQQFLNCLQCYALLPTIDKPTRVYKHSSSLIDNIFLNIFEDYSVSVSGILFQMSLITFPNFVFLNLVLRLPSLRKLQLVIILNFLSVLFYRNYRTLLGIQHCLQRIPLSHFLPSTTNWINFLINIRHFELYQSVKVNR